MRTVPFLITLLLASPLLADDQQPTGGARKPAELKILDRLQGSWKDKASFKASAGNKMEKKETASYQCSWKLGGRFLQSRGRNADGQAEDLQLMTFDEEQHCFRRWYFDSEGNASESSGTWDAKTETLTWTGDLGDGITAVSTWKFVDENTLVWSRVANDGQGKIYLDIEGKSVRQK